MSYTVVNPTRLAEELLAVMKGERKYINQYGGRKPESFDSNPAGKMLAEHGLAVAVEVKEGHAPRTVYRLTETGRIFIDTFATDIHKMQNEVEKAKTAAQRMQREVNRLKQEAAASTDQEVGE